MLYIDDKMFKIVNQDIFIGEYMKHGNHGYNINMQLEFINIDNNEKGYINLDAGFEKDRNIDNFLNKEYNGIPFEDDIFIEVYDTKEFLDTQIESNVVIKLKEIKDNKVEVFFEVNDELIKIKFDGYLNFDSTRTKETFTE